MDLGLTDRAAIVTGGGRGIGLRVARRLVGEGASVLLVGRSEAPLHDTVAHLGVDRAAACPLDITAPDAGERIAAACRDRFGRIDIVVNNAGGAESIGLDQLTDDEWQSQFDTHVMAPMRLMRAAIPDMLQRGWGRVVNVSSSSGKRPGTLNAAYAMSKAAELSLSRSFADAHASRGVLVNAITPGAVASEAWLEQGGLGDQSAARRGVSREQALAAVASAIPRGAMGTAEEIADVIVFLCSERAANVAGAAWSVDGGSVPVNF